MWNTVSQFLTYVVLLVVALMVMELVFAGARRVRARWRQRADDFKEDRRMPIPHGGLVHRPLVPASCSAEIRTERGGHWAHTRHARRAACGWASGAIATGCIR